MNYYDLSNPSTPPTRGYRLGLWRLRRQRIYRILIALAAILTYILLYLTLKRDDYTNDMLKAIVLLFCSVAVFLALLLVARNRIDVVRVRKREVQERHDYNYSIHYPASDGKAADRTAPSADGTAGTGAGEKGKIECSTASQFLFLSGSSAISGCTGELAGSADQLLCNPTKTAAVITGGNRKPVFTGEQSGQTGACCE